MSEAAEKKKDTLWVVERGERINLGRLEFNGAVALSDKVRRPTQPEEKKKKKYFHSLQVAQVHLLSSA